MTAISPRSYPEVVGLGYRADVVVDGELVALDERGRPDFARLQQRMHLTTPGPGWSRRCRCNSSCSTCCGRGEESLLELPYVQRRARLLELELDRVGVVVPANFTDTPGELDGMEVRAGASPHVIVGCRAGAGPGW